MMQRNPSAAEAIFPHLIKSQTPPVRQPLRPSNPLAASMYPALVKPAAKRTPADLKAWAEYIRRL
jgi:hypothetical protein